MHLVLDPFRHLSQSLIESQNDYRSVVVPTRPGTTNSVIISNNIRRIGAESPFKVNLSQAPITIAILDSGVYPHKDLNLVQNISVVSGTMDDCGHGTNVAGIAAAKNNSDNIPGVAPGAKLWSVKIMRYQYNPFDFQFECYGSADDMKAGLNYVLEHVKQIDVVNLSDGCNCNDTGIDDLVNSIVKAGAVVVTAAGNGVFVNNTLKPIDIKDVTPAHNPNAIAVSAMADTDGKCGGLGKAIKASDGKINFDDSYSTFSNFGAVTIAAPGVHVNSTWNNGGFNWLDGTSQAAPAVTGAIALLKVIHPTATPTELRHDLIQLATPPSATCNGDGKGYFSHDPNIPQEPMLYVKPLYSELPPQFRLNH